ncbi:hypothetical protein M4D81_28485 [Paenibacillus sp. p3-SID867]|uniref:hypothetical protein n=1 Tax=Paenibacillus sp. p3-SID867 TaxID=2916363 RepID=UPI0021A777AD|nr:hypothetical protein [Paenibacillus sp. p3-SID867]MCT1402936.1 hypothetical protein [Paenibacillus sp. p3-SID867]
MMMNVESSVTTWSITPGSATIERAPTAAITYQLMDQLTGLQFSRRTRRLPYFRKTGVLQR